jgi:hypothetical protein
LPAWNDTRPPSVMVTISDGHETTVLAGQGHTLGVGAARRRNGVTLKQSWGESRYGHGDSLDPLPATGTGRGTGTGTGAAINHTR